MPRKRKHTQTDTFIQDTLRAEITALKRRIEDFEREMAGAGEAISRAEMRGRDAQAAEAQTAADTKYVRSFLYWIFNLPPTAVLKGSYGAVQIRGGYDPDQSIQWKTQEIELQISELRDLAKALNRLGIK